ncbi:MAG: dipeptidase PepE, partial [Prevotellaceae bacterium]|nr:dipeptidase PepE [Prevotellaceae bacterium]
MKLLLISNSTNPGEAYLDYPKFEIQRFLGSRPVQSLFIPYAAVTFSYDEYETKVNNRFMEIGHKVIGIHHFDDPVEAVNQAAAIVVGGGNTWKLMRMMHDNGLIAAIRRKAQAGTPYIGWSAGSNVACPTLRTTNDMPIIDPKTFEATGLVPFQINPHYLDDNPSNHGGETREQRIEEFITQNPDIYVIGLREGTMLRHLDGQLNMIGKRSARIFRFGR